MLNKIIIGTAQFGQKYGYNNHGTPINYNEIERILEFASDNKINRIDTAISYGETEKIIGSFNLSNWDIYTKIPTIPTRTQNKDEWIIKSLEKSCQNLKTQKLKGVFFHKPNQLKNLKKKINIKSIQKLFKLTFMGISAYDIEEYIILKEKYNFNLIQIPYNVFDRKIENLKFRKYSKYIKIHVRSIFLQGVLLNEFNNLDNYFIGWKKNFLKWENWLKRNNLSHLEGCLSLIKNNKNFDNVVLGFKSLKQFKEIINILKYELPKPPTDLILTNKNLINPSKWKI